MSFGKWISFSIGCKKPIDKPESIEFVSLRCVIPEIQSR